MGQYLVRSLDHQVCHLQYLGSLIELALGRFGLVGLTGKGCKWACERITLGA